MKLGCLVLFTLISRLVLAQPDGGARAVHAAAPRAGDRPLAPERVFKHQPVGEGPAGPNPTKSPSGPNLTGLVVALGSGVSWGFGDLYTSASSPEPLSDEDVSLSGSMSWGLPFSLTLGYRPIPLLSFGLTARYQHIFLEDGSGPSSRDEYVGGELRFHLVPERPLSPWLSVGFGYEWLRLERFSQYSGYLGSRSLDGYEFELQVGGDFRVGCIATVGPYVGLGVGAYRHLQVAYAYRGGSHAGVDIPGSNQAIHEWLTLGVRVALTAR